MSHTPGPWVEFADKGETIALMAAMRAYDVCNFAAPYPSRDDARLMAASPDLFTALKAFVDKHDGERWLLDPRLERYLPAMRAALTKAERPQ